MMDLESVSESHKYLVNITSSSENITSKSVKCHARLRHIGLERMSRLAREGLLGSHPKVNLPTCKHCLVGKATRKPFGKAKRASHLLQLIHYDICGPMNVKSRNGVIYFITFIDDFSWYGSVFLLSHRSKALDYFKRFVVEVEN